MTEKYKFKFPSNIICPHCGKAGNVWYIDSEVYSAVCTECHQFIRKNEKSMTCLDNVDNSKDINTDAKNEYDVIIIGAGSGGIYCAKELIDKYPNLKILMLEKGSSIEKRNCPIVNNRVKNCIHCENGCSIMNGFGGAGAFSDGKYVITNEYGGNLKDYVGEDIATSLMEYVDKINTQILSDYNIPLYDSRNATFNKQCLQNDIHILNSKIRHLGTDLNYKLLTALYKEFEDKIDIHFNSEVTDIKPLFLTKGYQVCCNDVNYYCKYCVVSVGRSGSKWLSELCKQLNIKTTSNKIDIGVRVELPYTIFSHITDEVYEGKLVYRTKQYNDLVRTFCMNPRGAVVSENTNGIITVNGHSYEDEELKTTNTNFALLVSKHLTEPFNDSNEYGASIARLSNMLGDGVLVQRFGDLVKGQRSTDKRIAESFIKPTLKATAGDLSLVIPKRYLDDIIEMIYALDKIAPGTANDDTLLYGVEVKFYNMSVELNKNLEAKENLYIIGDGSGVTHSLAQASASGVYVAGDILVKEAMLD